MMTQVSQQSQQQAAVKASVSPLVQSGAAMLFGAIVLFAVGFLPMDAAHNAAHDTRHAFVFPCH